MIKISAQIEIDQPRQAVFEYIVDPERAMLWRVGVVNFKSQPGMPAGSRGEVVLQAMGHEITSKFEVLENNGISHMRAQSHQGPLRYETTHTLEALTDSRTRLTIHTRIDAGAVFRLAEPALEGVVTARLETDLATLKALMEQ